MNEYYFHVVILNNCSFSNAAKEILINSNIKTTFTNVNSDNKNFLMVKLYVLYIK